jgi:hypothetical protein
MRMTLQGGVIRGLGSRERHLDREGREWKAVGTSETWKSLPSIAQLIIKFVVHRSTQRHHGQAVGESDQCVSESSNALLLQTSCVELL